MWGLLFVEEFSQESEGVWHICLCKFLVFEAIILYMYNTNEYNINNEVVTYILNTIW